MGEVFPIKNLPKNLVNANEFLSRSNKINKIYYKGILDESVFNNCLAVIGSRRSTSYGERVCRELVGNIASSGITIVSGFMYGIDSCAHRAALDVGGKTIAVLGYGIKREPPSYQKELYRDIANSNGLFISEYENFEPAQKWTFPKRNRVVAGLSKAVLVIEADENSGSLITANYALKMKRRVFVVSNTSKLKNSLGIDQLIESGAQVVNKSEEILEFFDKNSKLAKNNRKEKTTSISGGKVCDLTKKALKTQIRECLKSEQPTIYELIAEFGENHKNLLKELTFMQLTGEICEIEGRYYIK